jgi:hypothetical protein
VKLSQNDLLARYGRVAYKEGDTGDKPLSPAQNATTGTFGGLGGLANEARPRRSVAKALQRRFGAGSGSFANEDGGIRYPRLKNDSGAFSSFRALQRDLAPFIEEAGAIFELPEDEQMLAFEALRKKLAEMPKGNALAEEFEMMLAEAYVEGVGEVEALANEDCRAKDPANCRTHGTGEHAEKIKPWHEGKHSKFTQSFLNGRPMSVSAQDADVMLREEIHVTDYDGKQTKFGRYLKNHLEEHSRDDSEGRKRKLLYAVDTVRTTASKDDAGNPGRKVWNKNHSGFNMTVVADKNGNIQDVRTIVPKGGKK